MGFSPENNSTHSLNTTNVSNSDIVKSDKYRSMSENELTANTDLSHITTAEVTVKRRKRTILEPAIFLSYLATQLISAVLQNQELYQACVSVYNYSEEVCEPFLGVIAKTNESQAIETQIQPYVTKIISASTIILSVLPAFLSLFIGPWSDRHGRRPILIAAFSATLVGHVITTILAIISMATPVNPWVYVISSIPLALTGGTIVMGTMVVCMISDVSDAPTRARRLFIVEGAMGIAMLVGNLISSYLLALTGTVGVFSIATGLDILALIYFLMFVGESLQLVHEQKDSRVREFFKFDLLKDMVKTCVRRRPNLERGIIWCLMFILVATSFVTQGESVVFYMFTRNKFNLTLQEFTTFNSAQMIIKMVGCGIILLLLRVLFKASLTLVALMGLVSCFADSAIRSSAQELWQLYMASAFGFMAGINLPMLQSVLAGLVEATEIGKIYGVISSLQALSPLASTTVYTAIYNATLETYPGAFYLLSAGIYLLSLVLIFIMYIMQRLNAKAARAQAEENSVISVES